MINPFFKKIKSTKLKISNVLVIILSLIIAFAAVYKWFSNGTISYYWDGLLPLSMEHTLNFLFSWGSNIFPGASGAGWSWLPYVLSVSGLEKVLGNISLAQAVLYIIFIFLSIISFYLLSNYLLNGILNIKKEDKVFKIISFLFAAYYSLNLYTFYYSYFMFNPQIYIYSVLPINFLSLLKLYPLVKNGKRTQKDKTWILIFFASLFFMTPGFTSYVFLAQYLILIVFYLAFHWFIAGYKIFTKKILELAVFFVLVVLTQWWWFFPTFFTFKSLFSSQSGIGTIIYFDLGSIRSNLLNSLRLLGSPMMNNNAFSWDSFYNENLLFSFPLFLFLFLIIFLLTRMKILKHTGVVIYFLIIFLATLFLVKLDNHPLAWITKFAFEHIPFFGAFRDSYQKSGLYYVFSYFILSGIGFGTLIKFLIENGRSNLVKLSFFGLLITGIVVTGPFFLFSYDNIQKVKFRFNENNYTFSAKTNVPPEYYKLKSILENQCKPTATLVIPRTSLISNAVWSKYNTSYVGQDFLVRLINCNFISVQLLQNDPDAFATAPYLMLQQGDFVGFKNFLLQNQIGFVLIRKDYVPYYFTNWVYVDPTVAIKLLDNDVDFRKNYENDFFALYEVLPLKNNNNYGFALPSTVVSTNSSLSTGRDYAVLAKQMPTDNGPVILNKKEDLKKHNSFVNLYTSIANCVGCVKIDASSVLFKSNTTLKKRIKDIIFPILKMFMKINPPTKDEEISYSILAANDEFTGLMTALKNKNPVLSKRSIVNYISSLENTKKLLDEYRSDFFAKNNKITEVKNFLTVQNSSLLAYFRSKDFSENAIKNDLYPLLILQNKELEFLKNNIWETDFNNNIYRMRLDIPRNGQYECRAESSSTGLNVTDVSIDNLSSEIKLSSASAYYNFSKGSYPVTINYSTNKILDLPSLIWETGKIQEVILGKIDNGDYSFHLDFKDSNNHRIAIIISENRLNNENLKGINLSNVFQDGFVFADSLEIGKKNIYRNFFTISSLSKPLYYLYLIPLETLPTEDEQIEIGNVRIERIAENNDIQYFCNLKTDKKSKSFTDNIKVNKINSTKYEVELPDNYPGGFLTFNQTYSEEWEASTLINGKKHIYEHFTNSYANGWFIDNSGNRRITVIFTRQYPIVKNAVLTFAGFIVGIFLYLRIRKKT